MTSTARVRATLDADLAPGTKVWLSACWRNPRAERGPAAAGVSTHVGHELDAAPPLARAA